MPMPFVSIGLIRLGDSVVVSEAFTDTSGHFALSTSATGRFHVIAQHIGFHDHTSEVFDLEGSTTIDIGIIVIRPREELLNEVIVTGEKPLLTSTMDRKVYNVGQDLLSSSGSASDVMSNIPSLTVDLDGNVSLRGSSNVTILIDGRPSPLMRRNPGAALQQIPASHIERIEIITNPSAKFRPDGTAGIINIVMKKGTGRGLSGTARMNVGNDLRHNANLNVNYRTRKVNLFGSYGYRLDHREWTSTEYREGLAIDSPTLSIFNSTTEGKYRPFSNTAQLGADFFLDSLNEFGISGSLFFMKLDRESSSHTTFEEPPGQMASEFDQVNSVMESENEKELAVHFEHMFGDEDHTLAIEAAFVSLVEMEDFATTETYMQPSSFVSRYNTTSTLHERPWDVAADYVRPVGEEGELELGYEGEFINQRFDFTTEYFDESLQEFVRDSAKSSEFSWDQHIHAGYLTYGSAMEAFGFLVGLRAEQTRITSHLITLDSVVPNNYFKLYPTVHLSYELDDGKELGFSYSKRVHRLEGDEMNPFPVYADPRDIEAGNPHIKPEQIHSIELSCRQQNDRFTLMPSLYYRFLYDGFEEVSTLIDDTVVYTTFENVASRQAAGIELIFTTKLAKRVAVNLSLDGFYQELNATNLGLSGNKSALSWAGKMNANVDLTKTTVLQLNTRYRTAELTAQGEYPPFFVMSGGLRQQVLKRRGELTFTVSDIFNTMRWESTLTSPGELYQHTTRKRKSQIVYVGFAWRFGKAAPKKSEELKFDEGS